MRDEVVARYQKLNLSTYGSGLNANSAAKFGPGDRIENVDMSYPTEPVAEFLVYASMYDRAVAPSAGSHWRDHAKRRRDLCGRKGELDGISPCLRRVLVGK